MGKLETGGDAIRTSKGQRRDAGVTSDYLPIVETPGWLAHGTTWNNARGICATGLKRADRLHIHFGTFEHGDSRGVLPGSEAIVVVDGNARSQAGIEIRGSGNNVLLSEGREGVISPRFISQAFQTRSREELRTNADGWLANSMDGETSEEEKRERDKRREKYPPERRRETIILRKSVFE